MSNLSPKARALVDAGRSACGPAEADRARLLGALRARLGDEALPLETAGAGRAAAAAGRGLWLVSGGVLGVGLLGGALLFGSRQAQRAPQPAPVVATVQAPDPVAPPVAAPPPSAVSTPETTEPSARRPAQDHLAEEVALLSRATAALHAGRAADALKALDEHRRKFPKGRLSEERGAARAQALCALGRLDEARAELAGLAAQSPSAARARQICEQSAAGR
jgi:hypothetical protein